MLESYNNESNNEPAGVITPEMVGTAIGLAFASTNVSLSAVVLGVF